VRNLSKWLKIFVIILHIKKIFRLCKKIIKIKDMNRILDYVMRKLEKKFTDMLTSLLKKAGTSNDVK